ncbi:MAG: hypothetical protein RXR43_03040 [Sulfolobus sp.]
MMKGRKSVFILLTLFLLPIFSTLTVVSQTSQQQLTIIYERYGSIYSYTEGSITPITHLSTVTYTTESVLYKNTVSSNSTLQINYNKTIYLLTFSSTVKNFSGVITINASENMGLTITSTIPNLIRIIVNTSGQSTLVWSGLSTSNITINTYAYINGSGSVILQFANGTSVSNLSVNVKAGQVVSERISLLLYEISSVSVKLQTTGTLTVTTQIPRRYTPLFFSTLYNGTQFVGNSSGVIATMAYFNGTLVPALIWKGEGIGLQHFFMLGKLKAQFETIEFYGVNGTVLGYVHMVSISGSENLSMGFVSQSTNLYFGEEKIVQVQGVQTQKPQFISTTYINGNPVIIVITTQGKASSTANVTLYHEVIINSSENFLVIVAINSTAKAIVVTNTNSTINVTVTKPVNVTTTNVNISGKVYTAQQVTVNATSRYILFNVSLMINTSAVTVYKVVDGKLIQLNSENYFVSNGKVYIFDDPSTTYYVVYGVTSTPQTTTTQNTTTPSASSVPVVTSSPSSPTISSTTSSNLVYITIGVILIIIIVGVVLVFRRR